ncbi:MAG: YjfB family protein [Roseburia sp.]
MDLTSVDAALGTLKSYDASSSVSTGSLAYAVGISMLDKTMEMTETMNLQLMQALESSVTPHLGSNVDVYL